MGRMTRLPLLVAGMFVAATCGCGSDAPAPRKIDATTSAAQSAQYTGALVRQLGQAIAFENGEGGLLAQLKDLLGGVQLKQMPQISPAGAAAAAAAELAVGHAGAEAQPRARAS